MVNFSADGSSIKEVNCIDRTAKRVTVNLIYNGILKSCLECDQIGQIFAPLAKI